MIPITAAATDGASPIYSADPKRDSKAKRYEQLTHQKAIERDLKVMDTTAFALARENRMPIIVLSIGEPGAIEAVLRGEGARDHRRDLTRPIFALDTNCREPLQDC